MIDYETYHQIKIMSEDEKMTPPQIGKELGVSPGTVRKYLKQPRYQAPQKRELKKGKLGPFKKRVKSLLMRRHYTAAQIFHMIRNEGYKGCESVVRDYVSKVRPKAHKAYLTLNFEPGEAAQVDFASCGKIAIGERRQPLYCFLMCLCHSRMLYVEFILRQSMEHFLQCHRNALEYFGAVPDKMIVDNCKVAIAGVPRYGDPVVNPRYGDLAAHYGFRVVACNVRSPHEKGIVEKNVSFLRTSFLNGLEYENLGLSALNHGLRQWMEKVANVRVHRTTRKVPQEIFKQEKGKMQPLPLFPYDCHVTKNVRANSQYRVVFESNKYSVPPEFTGKKLALNIYPEKLIVRDGAKAIAEHERSYEKNRDFGLPDHDKKLLAQRKKANKGRLLQLFFSLGSIAESYYKGLSKKRVNPELHVRKIIALLEIYGRNDTLNALEDAIKLEAFSSDYIANILEMRSRKLPEPGPLHLSRKSDSLDIDIDEPDLELYNLK